MKFLHSRVLMYLNKKFKDISDGGKEIRVNSIFCNDSKKHLYINCEKGVYHCWKSNIGGELPELIQKLEKCSYKEAWEILTSYSLDGFDEKMSSLFEDKFYENHVENKVKLPENTHYIHELDDVTKKVAEDYLYYRKIDNKTLMFCKSGKYANRIIIPYFGKNNELIYWNGRDVTDKNFLRYRGPDKIESGYGKSDVLYVSDWTNTDRLYITEGEFDCLSLIKSGLNSCACGGKELSLKQFELLKSFPEITLAFDADDAGKKALIKLARDFTRQGFKNVNYIIPSIKYKDWNKMLRETGENIVKVFVLQNENKLNPLTIRLKL